MKTKFSSYCLNDIAEGCKYCVKGRKLVLFISGLCARNCFYCSLSRKRKQADKIWANERECQNIKEAIEEAKASCSTGAGITGGDPLLRFNRTLKYARALKKKFGKKFHIHIYLPTSLLTKEKLKKLALCVDEVRFHPKFLSKKPSSREIERDIKKILLANLFFRKNQVGIELPVLPDKKKEILYFIARISSQIGFVNLNELELSETNFNYIIKHYKLKENGYVIAGSKEAGLWILKQCEKAKLKLKIHLCTAETKNWHQYKNRLNLHSILPYGFRTEEGTAIYFAIYYKSSQEFRKLKKDFKKYNIYADKNKKRIILPKRIVLKLAKKYKIMRVEEYPTYDRFEIEKEELKQK